MTYHPYYPPQRPTYPPVYRPPVPLPPRRRTSPWVWVVCGVGSLLAVIILIMVAVGLVLTPSTPRVQDTQSYQTGQQIGATEGSLVGGDVMSWVKAGLSASEACKIGISMWPVYHTRDGQFPAWWDGKRSPRCSARPVSRPTPDPGWTDHPIHQSPAPPVGAGSSADGS